ncbi:CHAP domain-containing protein [Lactococcus petauri]|uniref:CHAP domain-containing protein n=1 Tax=Lactococcus petauri TaxID=1940789 RepID=UPI00385531B5
MNFNKKQKKSTKSVVQGMIIGGLLLSSGLKVRDVVAGGVSLPPVESQPKEEMVQRVTSVPESGSAENSLTSLSTAHYTSTSYGYKQCTWWAYNRARDFGISYGETMGNGSDWKFQPGYTISSTPVLHSVISFNPGQTLNNGQWYADSVYGHVAFVEAVYEDGSLLISESGMNLEGEYQTQRISAQEANTLSYVIGHTG